MNPIYPDVFQQRIAPLLSLPDIRALRCVNCEYREKCDSLLTTHNPFTSFLISKILKHFVDNSHRDQYPIKEGLASRYLSNDGTKKVQFLPISVPQLDDSFKSWQKECQIIMRIALGIIMVQTWEEMKEKTYNAIAQEITRRFRELVLRVANSYFSQATFWKQAYVDPAECTEIPNYSDKDLKDLPERDSKWYQFYRFFDLNTSLMPKPESEEARAIGSYFETFRHVFYLYGQRLPLSEGNRCSLGDTVISILFFPQLEDSKIITALAHLDQQAEQLNLNTEERKERGLSLLKACAKIGSQLNNSRDFSTELTNHFVSTYDVPVDEARFLENGFDVLDIHLLNHPSIIRPIPPSFYGKFLEIFVSVEAIRKELEGDETSEVFLNYLNKVGTFCSYLPCTTSEEAEACNRASKALYRWIIDTKRTFRNCNQRYLTDLQLNRVKELFLKTKNFSLFVEFYVNLCDGSNRLDLLNGLKLLEMFESIKCSPQNLITSLSLEEKFQSSGVELEVKKRLSGLVFLYRLRQAEYIPIVSTFLQLTVLLLKPVLWVLTYSDKRAVVFGSYIFNQPWLRSFLMLFPILNIFIAYYFPLTAEHFKEKPLL